MSTDCPILRVGRECPDSPDSCILFDGAIVGIADVTNRLPPVRTKAQRPYTPKRAKLGGEESGSVFVGGPMSAALLQLGEELG